ncbi:DEAD/DEAH box helicase [Clostridium sp. MSJ-4]|uniref:DEAD/DEAH box helicase n=1 Tax=Clostridium simiarum TaxID=2841506 RepID=A0ABS6EY73_9CLOT|nr:DEAD/DEAH box helicase [Clostridium simiarum]MBU5591179.1 DEAD/DEAH box helicase [Clostridium simiarum]
MNLKQLVDIVLAKSSKWMKNEGHKLYKNGLVSRVKSKKIDNVYNIYGKVKEENKAEEHSTHIRVNMSKGKLEQTICSCEEFSENSIYNKAFMCRHLVATTYRFYDLATKKIEAKSPKEEKYYDVGDIILKQLNNYRHSKEKVKMEIKLIHIPNSSSNYYEVEIKIGKDNMYVINSLEDFVEARIKGTSLFISNEFIYDPKVNYFSEEDEKIAKFVEEYILIKKEFLGGNLNSSFQLVNGRKFRILNNSLRRFLEILHNKKISFKYDYIEYSTRILCEDLPVFFTLKEEGNKFVLTTKDKFPIPLDEKGEVYLYNRELYLPSKIQSELYRPFYNELKDDGKITFSKNAEVFQELIAILNMISQEINFDVSVRDFATNLLLPKFYFYKELEKIFCEAKLTYGDEEIDIIKDSKKKQALIRDFKKEEKIEMELEKLKFIKREDRFVFTGEDEDIYNLLTKGFKSLKSIGEVILLESFNDIKLYDSSSIESSITEGEKGTFNFNYNIGRVPKEEFNHIFMTFKSGKSFYKTKDNSFIDLEDDGIGNFLNLLDGLNYNSDVNGEAMKIDKNKGFYIESLIENKGLSFIRGKELLKEISGRIRDIDKIDYELPKGLKATLRDYQVTGYKWFKSLSYMNFGGILADEMGLGKTVQTISFLLSEKGANSLIVTPTSLIYNWKDEFENFAPELRIGIIHGNKKDRMKVFEDKEKYDVILTTYGTLKNDFQLYKKISFDYCIIDEGQNIKNPLAQSTGIVKQIDARGKFALTGTPIENNLMELWSIFDFIMPGYLYNKEKFEDRFINEGYENIEELKTLIRPFILRREKEDVLKELPEKIEKKFLVEMTSRQNQIYKAYMKEIREKLKNNKEDKITVFSYLTKLRQLCLDPALIIDNYSGGSGKLKIAMTLVEEGIKEGKKILLFSQFTSMLKNISYLLEEAHIDYLYLDGKVKASDRIKLVKDFNESSNINVFLISLKAGGTGLNLTSANLVIHFDPWWNPAVEDQATDRAHRIGQKNLVQVIKLVSQGTIEEKIIKLQEDKKELINNIMNGDLRNGQLLNSLTQEEIMDLFN